MDILEAEVGRWGKVWRAKKDGHAEHDELEAEFNGVLRGKPLPPRLRGADLRRATRSLPQRGIATPDVLHPRCFALLSEAALDVLAEMFNAAEALGRFPTATESLIVGLVDKLVGGTRPIGVVSTTSPSVG